MRQLIPRSVLVLPVFLVGCTPAFDASSSKILSKKQVEIGASVGVKASPANSDPSDEDPGITPGVIYFFRRRTPQILPRFRLGMGSHVEAYANPMRVGVKYGFLDPKKSGDLGLALDARVSGPVGDGRYNDTLVQAVRPELGAIVGLFAGDPLGTHGEFVASVYGGQQIAAFKFPYVDSGFAVRICSEQFCLVPELRYRYVPTFENLDYASYGIGFLWKSAPSETRNTQ